MCVIVTRLFVPTFSDTRTLTNSDPATNGVRVGSLQCSSWHRVRPVQNQLGPYLIDCINNIKPTGYLGLLSFCLFYPLSLAFRPPHTKKTIRLRDGWLVHHSTTDGSQQSGNSNLGPMQPKQIILQNYSSTQQYIS